VSERRARGPSDAAWVKALGALNERLRRHEPDAAPSPTTRLARPSSGRATAADPGWPPTTARAPGGQSPSGVPRALRRLPRAPSTGVAVAPLSAAT
jgi:hypothetical protein